MASFLEQIVLGIFQGVVEWLPFSSEGILLFIKTVIFNHSEINLEAFIREALYLHFGTFFAALIYFWSDVKTLFKGAFNYKHTDIITKKTIDFLLISTLISGGLFLFGYFLLELLKINLSLSTEMTLTSQILLFLLGGFLIITGITQIKSSKKGIRQIYHLKPKDSIFAGFMQSLAAFPGLSRSGLTVSSLLFRRIDETVALKLSFLMSLPVILMLNIVSLVRGGGMELAGSFIWGFLASFIVGYLTIGGLMKLSKRVKFGGFVIIVAVLVIISGIVLPYLGT